MFSYIIDHSFCLYLYDIRLSFQHSCIYTVSLIIVMLKSIQSHAILVHILKLFTMYVIRFINVYDCCSIVSLFYMITHPTCIEYFLYIYHYLLCFILHVYCVCYMYIVHCSSCGTILSFIADHLTS